MSTKSELKQARSLLQKKYRIQYGQFLVQGRKLVMELLGSDFRTDVLYATARASAELGVTGAIILPDHEMARLGSLESGNELVAVAGIPEPQELPAPSQDGLVLALDGITDPGNLGTLLRIADWFGIPRVICSPNSVDSYNPKCVQASMGSIFRVVVHREELAPMLARSRDQGATLYMADAAGASVFSAALELPAVLVLGSESHGISAEVRGLGGTSIAIPRLGGAESLNVAAAAAALCTEFTRQRLAR